MNVSIKPPVIIVTANGISGNRAIAISAEIASNASSAAAAAASAAAAAAAAASINTIPAIIDQIADGTYSSFTVGFPVDERQIDIYIGGAPISPEFYTAVVAVDGLSTTITWLGYDGAGATLIEEGLRVYARATIRSTVDLAKSGYDTRAAFVSAVALGLTAVDGTVVGAGRLSYVAQAGATGIPDLPGWVPFGTVYVGHMGDVGSDVSDDTAAFAAALKFDDVVIPTGVYRIYGTLTPKSNQTITAAPGATLKQYGQTLWQGPADLTNFKMLGITFDFRGSALNWTVWGNFRAHMRCVFKDLRFVRYDNVHIMERQPVAADTINTIDNLYSDWSISACRSVSIDIGLEGFYFKATGDGVTTVYDTGLAWGASNPGSVVVLRETPGGFFSELTAADYSVTFPSGNLVVTFVAAPTTGQRIHVWPSNPRTDGNRRPISNNEWRNIRCDYIFGNGHVAVRWVDAETYRFERLLLAANNTACYVTNPYNTRNGQGGDFASYEDCILSYQAATGLVTDVTSVRAFNFGPGSLAMSGRGVRMDFAWQSTEYGTSRVIEKRDRRLVTLAGTVSVTTGSAIVTGVGTAFLRDLTMLGSDKDVVLIGPTFFAAIASVDSDTQITLTAAVGANLTNVSISRLSKTSAISYDMNFAAIGSGFWNNRSSSVGRAVYGSATKNSGIATILSGTTSITFLHLMRRRPLLNEVRLTPNGAATVGAWVTIPNDSQITISVATAPGADAPIGWGIELSDLN